MKKQKYPLVRTKVWQLSWGGDMEARHIKLAYPKEIFKVDGWGHPTVGELCIYEDKIRIVRRVVTVPSDSHFKAHRACYFVGSKYRASISLVYRLEVRKGKKFKLYGKTFVAPEPAKKTKSKTKGHVRKS